MSLHSTYKPLLMSFLPVLCLSISVTGSFLSFFCNPKCNPKCNPNHFLSSFLSYASEHTHPTKGHKKSPLSGGC